MLVFNFFLLKYIYIYIGLKIKPAPIKNKFDLLFIHWLIQMKNPSSIPMSNAKNSILYLPTLICPRLELALFLKTKKKVPSYFI
jgi:hypothetical protein